MEFMKTIENKSAFINACVKEHIEREKAQEVMLTVQKRQMLDRVSGIAMVSQDAPSLVPLFDAGVACGRPTDVGQVQKEYVDMNQKLCPNPDQYCLVVVKGESMIDAGIQSGALVNVDLSDTETMGHDAMLCVVDGEATIKFVERRDEGYVLIPANEDFQEIPIAPDVPFYIMGKVKMVVQPVLRRFDKKYHI